MEDIMLKYGLHLHNDGTPTRDFSGNLSAIDLALSARCNPNLITWQVDKKNAIWSDHYPILTTLKTMGDSLQVRSHLSLADVDWTAWEDAVSNKLEDLGRSLTEMTDPDQACKDFTDTIQTLAAEKIPRKRICRHSKPFWNSKMSELLKLCKLSKKTYKRRRTPNNFTIHQGNVSKFMVEYKKAFQEWQLEKCEQLKENCEDPWRTINKLLNGGTSAPVQPLERDDDDYDFNDVDIAERLKKVHIMKTITPGRFDDIWFNEINNSVQNTIEHESTALVTDASASAKNYNSDLTSAEIAVALSLMKSNSSPGPDEIHPKLIKFAGLSMKRYLLQLFQLCWKTGKIPKIWKRENKIFIPKPGKESYHTEKSYRPLGLTSVVGKLYERVITRRLLAALHEQAFFEPEQFAYLQGRDITQALLSMTLPILSGFKHNHDTAAVLINLEGAFDNVWREAVLYKLAKAGNHIKYADDITLWETSNCLHTAVANLEVKLQQLEKWCNTWRFSVNTSKTNVMCFSKRGHKDIAVHMGSHRLTQVNECRCLGVILTRICVSVVRLKQQLQKAMRALCKISALTSHTAGASMELMLLLYLACIRPHLEFAYPVWCTVRSISALERVQNLALRMATGTFVHCSSDAVEVMSHTLPLDIRLREILARTLCQYILSKEETDNFRVLVQSLLGDPAFSRGPRSTPLCLMTRALKDLNVSLQVNDPGSQPIEDMSDILSCRMEEVRIEWRKVETEVVSRRTRL
nr:uncharacterized protein LOC129281722 [Lytechinus pictus]